MACLTQTFSNRELYTSACLFLDGDHDPVGLTAFVNETRSYEYNSLVIFECGISNVG